MHIGARWQTAGEVRKVPTVDIGAGRSRISGDELTDIGRVSSRILDVVCITGVGGVRTRGPALGGDCGFDLRLYSVPVGGVRLVGLALSGLAIIGGFSFARRVGKSLAQTAIY